MMPTPYQQMKFHDRYGYPAGIPREVFMTKPNPDPEQYMEALDRANRYRVRRAEVKRAIYAGDLEITVELMEEEALAGMPLAKLLDAQRGWHRVRVRRALLRLMIGELRQLGQLTARQRRVVVELVSEEAKAR